MTQLTLLREQIKLKDSQLNKTNNLCSIKLSQEMTIKSETSSVSSQKTQKKGKDYESILDEDYPNMIYGPSQTEATLQVTEGEQKDGKTPKKAQKVRSKISQ